MASRFHVDVMKQKGDSKKEIHLKPLEELIGFFRGFDYDGRTKLCVDLDIHRARFLLEPSIAKRIVQTLKGIPIGSRVAILRVSHKFLVREVSIDEC